MQLSPNDIVIQPKDLGDGRLFETIRDAAIVIDTRSGTIVLWNPAATAIFGYTAEEARRHRLEHLIPEYPQISQQMSPQRSAANGDSSSDAWSVRELSGLHKNGDQLQIELTLNPMPDVGDGKRFVLAILRDITARTLKQIDGEHQSANKQLASRVQELQDHTNELTVLSELSTIIQVCRTAEETYSVIATSLSALLPHESGCLSIFQSSRDLLDPVASWGVRSPTPAFRPNDCWALRRGQMYGVDAAHPRLPCSHVGFPAPNAYICLPLIARGEPLGVLHLYHADVMGLSEARRHLAQTVAAHLALVLANLRLQESLRYQLLRDALTGLYNRCYLEGALEREAIRALRLGQSIGVLMLDIDHYKQFNDANGHSAGDTVLRVVGNLLRARSRGEDIVCRYGGEEFGLVLPGASLEVSRRRAEHIRIAVKELQVQHGDNVVGQITCSIGVAAFPQHGATLTDAIEFADQAMYRAKHEGRDRVVVG